MIEWLPLTSAFLITSSLVLVLTDIYSGEVAAGALTIVSVGVLTLGAVCSGLAVVGSPTWSLFPFLDSLFAFLLAIAYWNLYDEEPLGTTLSVVGFYGAVVLAEILLTRLTTLLGIGIAPPNWSEAIYLAPTVSLGCAITVLAIISIVLAAVLLRESRSPTPSL